MADGVEEKWPKGIIASIAFLFILVLMLATLAPNALIDKVMQKERQWSISLLAQDDLNRIVKTTESIYTTVVIDSGAQFLVSDVFMPRGKRWVDAFEEATGWWFGYLAARGEALQKIIYQVIFRIVLIMYWLPFFLVVVAPAVYAGYMRWQAKRHGFDYSSPFLNNNAANMICWGIVLIALSILAPFPLPPLLVCTFIIIILPVLLSVLIRNLPKQI